MTILLKDFQEATALFGDMELALTRQTADMINQNGIYQIGHIEGSNSSSREVMYYFRLQM